MMYPILGEFTSGKILGTVVGQLESNHWTATTLPLKIIANSFSCFYHIISEMHDASLHVMYIPLYLSNALLN